MTKPWTVATALEQIESCGFECPGGALDYNQAWTWLTARAAELTLADIQARTSAAARALQAKGWGNPIIDLLIGHSDIRLLHIQLERGSTELKTTYRHETIEAALDHIDEAVAAAPEAPHRWTAEDVAATIGLPVPA